MDHQNPKPSPDLTHDYDCNCDYSMLHYTLSERQRPLWLTTGCTEVQPSNTPGIVGIMILTNTWSPAAPTEFSCLLSCTGEDCNIRPYGENCTGIFACLPVPRKEGVGVSVLLQVYRCGTLSHLNLHLVELLGATGHCDSKQAQTYRFICTAYLGCPPPPSHLAQQPYAGQACLILEFFLEYTQWHTAFGRIPLDEGSARHRDMYLTIHNTSMPPTGFEPGIWASERPQTFALDDFATWIAILDNVAVLNYIYGKMNPVV